MPADRVPYVKKTDNKDVEEVGVSTAYITKEHLYAISESPRKIKRKFEEIIDEKEKKMSLLRKKLKVCKLKNKRKVRRIKTLIDVISNLKSEKLINTKLASTLEENFSELSLAILKDKSKKPKYNELVKSFALSLFFYSPKAYEYVRRSLSLSLPHPCTVRRWYNVIDGNPGFTAEALSALKSRIDITGYKVYFALIFDEMSIKKHIDWDGKTFFGYSSMGSNICKGELSEAREVLVFMAVGVNVSWSIPIAYFLVNGTSAQEKANLVSQAILILHDLGGNVISVTFDGTSTNFAAAEILGANILKPLELKPYFNNPADETSKVYIVPDACHMVKLLRNVFADLTLIDRNGKYINWFYIQNLNSLQNSEGLTLANKLRNKHVEFYQNKMKVSLAVQVFSKSVAEALKFASQTLKLEQFKNVSATIDFLLIVNDLFDLCNSKNCLAKGSKAALKLCNKYQWEPFLNNASNYLLGLKDSKNGKLLFETTRRTPVIGLVCLIGSLKGLFEDLVLTNKLKYLATYKLSQDHIEMLFSKIRQRGGWNNNPSAVQFRASYKQLLVKNDIKASKNANIQSQVVSESLPCFSVLPEVSETLFRNVLLERLFDINSEFEEEEDDDDSSYNMINSSLSEYSSNIVFYIAGYVVKKLATKIKCAECAHSLFENETLTNQEYGKFLFQKDKGGLTKPSEDVMKICLLAEKCVRAEPQIFQGNAKLKIVIRVLKHTIGTPVFNSILPHTIENSSFPENHISSLIKAICNVYLNIRFHHLSKCKNSKLQRRNVRQKLTKLILFKNQ